ncbi:YqaJ viral recombinase family protein [Rhodococcoides fascians]|uniref:YqaJ viral recombinase family protein n=1 Tax=Rhodococcoides fascians TaxID=1828 RepID=UPI000563B36E|nr:YqaJ viral recombinase family protein [Rhodococcus fascians]
MSVKIKPGSPEWLATMSPSKAAAVLGLSRWESPRSLWHRMRGDLPPEDPKDEFAVGHAFELALSELWRGANPGWRLSPGEVQFDASDRFGFPFIATIDGRASRGSSRRVVEKKTARKLEEWGDFFTDEGPADYITQVIVQQGVSGYTREPAHLVVMGPFFQWHTYRVRFDADLFDEIVGTLRAFHRSLSDPDAGPALDDHVATYDTVRALHPDVDGSAVQLEEELALAYLGAVVDHRESEARLRGLKTEVLDVMGDAAEAFLTREEQDGKQTYKVAGRGPGPHNSIRLNPAGKKVMEALSV